jgi:Ni/Co efflux regulator RcnB
MKKLLITTLMAAFCWVAFTPETQAQDTTRRQQDTTRKHQKSKMPKDKKKDKRDTTQRKQGDTTTRPPRPL